MSSRKDTVETIVSLFRLYEQKMYHIAFAILHDSCQAEDAVMDAFVRLLDRNYPIHDPASRKAKSLVIRVIRSSAIDIYRKNWKEREYVAIDEQAAENLIGEKVSTEPVSVQINDHTLIIDSAVRDENAIVMEFTLNCPAGVNALRYDALMNEGKGAAFSEKSTFYFKVKGTAGTIYVDLDRTTETSLHGYYYGVGAFSKLPASGTAPILEIGYADVPYQALMENAETGAALYTKEVEIPAVDAAEMTAFSSDTGGCLELSPISMTIDMQKWLGLSREEAYDPYHIETIAVEYKDGSVYQVLSGPDNIDNTACICGGLGAGKSELALVFNRLVSPADIRQVTVNGIGYTPE